MSAPEQRPHGLGPDAIEIVGDDWASCFVAIGENVHFSQPRPIDVETTDDGLTIMGRASALALADALIAALRLADDGDRVPTPAELACLYLARRLKDDGRLAYLIGPYTQSWELLTAAVAEISRCDVERYRDELASRIKPVRMIEAETDRG